MVVDASHMIQNHKQGKCQKDKVNISLIAKIVSAWGNNKIRRHNCTITGYIYLIVSWDGHEKTNADVIKVKKENMKSDALLSVPEVIRIVQTINMSMLKTLEQTTKIFL